MNQLKLIKNCQVVYSKLWYKFLISELYSENWLGGAMTCSVSPYIPLNSYYPFSFFSNCSASALSTPSQISIPFPLSSSGSFSHFSLSFYPLFPFYFFSNSTLFCRFCRWPKIEWDTTSSILLSRKLLLFLTQTATNHYFNQILLKNAKLLINI